jgi:Cu2+-containing amine oxidase
MRPYGRMGIKGRVIVSILAATATIAFSLVFTGWSSFGVSTGAPSLHHPLDPLTKEELITTVAVLKKAGKLMLASRLATIYLKEPPKDQVIADITAGRIRRGAFALAYNWATRAPSESLTNCSRSNRT